MMTCDECDDYIHDKSELNFIFREHEQNKNYDYSLTLCCKCFNDKFSIIRFAKLASKYNQNIRGEPKTFCCLCELMFVKKKDQYHTIRGFNDSASIEITYCKSCYRDDTGMI